MGWGGVMGGVACSNEAALINGHSQYYYAISCVHSLSSALTEYYIDGVYHQHYFISTLAIIFFCIAPDVIAFFNISSPFS